MAVRNLFALGLDGFFECVTYVGMDTLAFVALGLTADNGNFPLGSRSYGFAILREELAGLLVAGKAINAIGCREM